MESKFKKLKHKNRAHWGIFIVLFITFNSLFSCNKFLDVSPKSQIKQDELFTSKQGYIDALTGVYTQMTHRSLYGENLTFGFMDALAQYYEASTYTDHYFYRSTLYDYQDDGVKTRIASIWQNMYNNIANDNNLLAHIDQGKSLLSDLDYKIIKGEALGLRAFMHFDLLRAFGPVYITGKEKSAIPYVTNLSRNVHKILPAKVVADSIIADLREAETLLSVYMQMDKITSPNEDPSDPLLSFRQNHFNYWAVKAVLARVYLYIGDKQKALEAAKEVIENGGFSFVQQADLTTAKTNKNRTFSMEQIFSLYDFDLSTPVDTYFKGAANNAIRLTMTSTVRDQIFEVSAGGSADYRYAYLWETDESTLYPSKLWQEDDNQDKYKYLLPLVTLPEMYYIAAECTPDIPSAVQYLNKVRENRGLEGLPVDLDELKLKEEIFKAYQKEFFLEGQLFFYYKRLDLTHIERSSTTGSEKVFVFPLPDNELQFGDQTNH